MRIFVTDAAQADDLREFLVRAECDVERIDDQTYEVSVPAAHDGAQERLELDLYLRVWQATHTDVEVRALDN
jgi:hypothetical protein